MSPRPRVFETVVDKLRGARKASRAPRTSLDEALLFTTHERASKALQASTSTCHAAGATAAQQRSSLDAASDHARLLLARSRDVRGAARQVKDTLEAAKLMALNAGLEGSRLGEALGRPLVSFAEEIRTLLARGLEALDEHVAVLVQVDREREKLREQVEHARQAASQLAEELLRAQASQRESSAALEAFGQSLQRTTGTDPEVARVVSEAAEYARGLVSAFSRLSSHSQRKLVLRSLRPSIKPLLRLLREIERAADQERP